VKIVVIGGTGLIGTKLVKNLRHLGHDVLAASPSSGVNAVTGQGLTEALAGAQVVVDVANSPSFEDQAVLEFFQNSGRNLMAAEIAASVGHHLALSVVGTSHAPGIGYFRAKMAQEQLIRESGVPYTIVQATQFFEFLGAIADAGTVGPSVHASPALMQPIAADDVARVLTEIAVGPALDGTLEIAGPDRIPIDEIVRSFLGAKGDLRKVVADVNAGYFGARIDDQTLTPRGLPRLGTIKFEDWLGRAPTQL